MSEIWRAVVELILSTFHLVECRVILWLFGRLPKIRCSKITSSTTPSRKLSIFPGIVFSVVITKLRLGVLALLDHVNKVHEIEIRPSTVRPSVSQLSLYLMLVFFSIFTFCFMWGTRLHCF